MAAIHGAQNLIIYFCGEFSQSFSYEGRWMQGLSKAFFGARIMRQELGPFDLLPEEERKKKAAIFLASTIRSHYDIFQKVSEKRCQHRFVLFAHGQGARIVKLALKSLLDIKTNINVYVFDGPVQIRTELAHKVRHYDQNVDWEKKISEIAKKECFPQTQLPAIRCAQNLTIFFCGERGHGHEYIECWVQGISKAFLGSSVTSKGFEEVDRLPKGERTKNAAELLSKDIQEIYRKFQQNDEKVCHYRFILFAHGGGEKIVRLALKKLLDMKVDINVYVFDGVGKIGKELSSKVRYYDQKVDWEKQLQKIAAREMKNRNSVFTPSTAKA
ncbi:MAG: hypothetical protein KDK56_06395 [Simkania sp.]|nr:hypothetical protein [Simkania sp.]MCP5489677.1 hypothetical protein [Chlamydiales bacterium]